MCEVPYESVEERSNSSRLQQQLDIREHMPTITRVRKLVIELNSEAMDFLSINDKATALMSLDQALETIQILEDDETVVDKTEVLHQLKGLTHNNLGCVFKHCEDFEKALLHLKLALQNEASLKNEKFNNSSSTLLNICAILSRLGEHKQAYEYGLQAVYKYKASYCPSQGLLVNGLKADENLKAAIVIAYYNSAVEAEHLQLYQQAQELYKFAFQITSDSDKGLKKKIERALMQVNVKVRNKVQKVGIKPTDKLIISNPFESSVLTQYNQEISDRLKSKLGSHYNFENSIVSSGYKDMTLKEILHTLQVREQTKSGSLSLVKESKKHISALKSETQIQKSSLTAVKQDQTVKNDALKQAQRPKTMENALNQRKKSFDCVVQNRVLTQQRNRRFSLNQPAEHQLLNKKEFTLTSLIPPLKTVDQKLVTSQVKIKTPSQKSVALPFKVYNRQLAFGLSPIEQKRRTTIQLNTQITGKPMNPFFAKRRSKLNQQVSAQKPKEIEILDNQMQLQEILMEQTSEDKRNVRESLGMIPSKGNEESEKTPTRLQEKNQLIPPLKLQVFQDQFIHKSKTIAAKARRMSQNDLPLSPQNHRATLPPQKLKPQHLKTTPACTPQLNTNPDLSGYPERQTESKPNSQRTIPANQNAALIEEELQIRSSFEKTLKTRTVERVGSNDIIKSGVSSK